MERDYRFECFVTMSPDGKQIRAFFFRGITDVLTLPGVQWIQWFNFSDCQVKAICHVPNLSRNKVREMISQWHNGECNVFSLNERE